MKQSINTTEPPFVDEQNEGIDSLPTFVTRTTLRSILHANGVKALLELEARSTASMGGEMVHPEEPRIE
ncbi:hypothetical protein IFR35_03295 [Pseudomonas fluorescens]|uniref:hypothetical protein n=1 Tax=Pseudomonas fluorescens TaxID=294 RepID=UPI00177B4CC4|nr:hypothetical protein [Pseudomonas fluorescens]MBD8191494.1 hypothetical protein [Pseudomonas fluorescens]MBD8225521.1 hypothetical protein [Pseudomonas fluorescens]MBD8783243.1 hypothetical protein [Pseudomonas fluorescens]MBD8816665.1 hypothetical protein [Pseudomonas fluorescens]